MRASRPTTDALPADPGPPAPAWPAADLVAEGRRRYEAGDTADAEPLAVRALELRPPGSDPAARSEALQLLAEVAYGHGRYAEARAMAEEAATLRREAPDEERAETENLLGIVDLAVGEHARGLERVRHAYLLREAAVGPDHPDTLESLNNTGVALGRVGRMDEAIAAHEEALRRCERAFDAPHRQLAVSLNALAVKLDRNETTRARGHELGLRALEAAEAALGPEHPLVATLVSNIGTQRLNADDVEGARPFIARSLDLHERRHGPEHPSTATALLTGAELALRDGRPGDARDLLDRAVAIRLGAFGIADDRTKAAVTKLMVALAALLETDRSLQAEAAAVYGVYRNLDEAKAKVGPLRLGAPDPGEAERGLRAYLARVAARRPSEDPAIRRELDMARASLVAADANFMRGELDAAAVALRDAVERVERARGDRDLALVEPLHRLAAIERARDRRDRAIEVDRRALSILAGSYGEQHPYVLQGITRLAVETSIEYGRAAARPELERLLAILASAEEGGLAAHLRDKIERQLAAIAPDEVPSEIGLSARRREALATPSPLAQELLAGLGDVPWAMLSLVAGPATDTPDDLRLLLAHDAGVASEAARRLAASLSDPRGPSPGAAAALPFLVRIASDHRVDLGARAAALTLAVAVLASAIAMQPASAAGGISDTGRAASAERARREAASSILGREAAVRNLIERLAASGSNEERTVGEWARSQLRAARLRVAQPEGRPN